MNYVIDKQSFQVQAWEFWESKVSTELHFVLIYLVFKNVFLRTYNLDSLNQCLNW